MKIMLVGNDGVATAMLNALKNYYTVEDVKAVDFNHPTHKTAVADVEEYLKNFDTNEKLVVITDKFGSTAFTETVLALQKTGVIFNSLVLRGMSLPMILKVYSVKDNINGWQTIQKVYEKANVFTYTLNRNYIFDVVRKAG